MASDSLQTTVERLTSSPGGQILVSVAERLRASIVPYILLFTLGFVAAFPITASVITWLIADERLPSGVDIIVVSPVEYLMLQLRIASSFGLALVAVLIVAQLAFYGARHEAVQARLNELNVRLPRPGPALVLAVGSSLVLMVFGLLYAWHALIPMLLDYLTNDAQQAGLSTEWRLSNYAGFIVNLLAASALGFQAPLVTTIMLRSGMVSTEQLTRSRRAIWFGSFVVGALLSPPDPLSLFLVALPIIALFELALLIYRVTHR